MAAGIGDLSLHDLRHTAASLLVASGANVKAVRRMLGHASAAMTLDVYSGLFDDDLGALADRMDRPTRRQSRDVTVRMWAPCGHGTPSSRSTITKQAAELHVHRWGGWGSNPRPRDYESHALTG
jgi:hypothetical protein